MIRWFQLSSHVNISFILCALIQHRMADRASRTDEQSNRLAAMSNNSLGDSWNNVCSSGTCSAELGEDMIRNWGLF
jgi:hypothetical protein